MPQTTISFCTTCMNRAPDVKATFLQNIHDNQEVSCVEWLLLDYNSGDDLEEWAKNSLKSYIDAGVVTYVRTTEPAYYSMAHSRNVAFLAARGQYTLNVDADNFTGKGWAAFMVSQVTRHPEKSIFAMRRTSFRGRLGFRKTDFVALGGYDEQLEGYGYDDRDLMERALAKGYNLHTWGWKRFIQRIEQRKADKATHMKNKNAEETERANKLKSRANLKAGKVVANQGTRWGRAHLERNFTDRLDVGIEQPTSS